MTNDILLRSHLKRLRLPVITQNYARLSKEAAANNQSYQDYLLALLDGEVLQRDENAQKLRLARARFPVIKMLDSFDFTALPSLNKALVIELTRGNFVDRRENVIFIGSYGTGKTHLATALGIAACYQGKRVRFYTAAGLINELLEALPNFGSADLNQRWPNATSSSSTNSVSYPSAKRALKHSSPSALPATSGDPSSLPLIWTSPAGRKSSGMRP